MVYAELAPNTQPGFNDLERLLSFPVCAALSRLAPSSSLLGCSCCDWFTYLMIMRCKFLAVQTCLAMLPCADLLGAGACWS